MPTTVSAATMIASESHIHVVQVGRKRCGLGVAVAGELWLAIRKPPTKAAGIVPGCRLDSKQALGRFAAVRHFSVRHEHVDASQRRMCAPGSA